MVSEDLQGMLDYNIVSRLRFDCSRFPDIDVFIKDNEDNETLLLTINDDTITKEIIKELYRQFKEETGNK